MAARILKIYASADRHLKKYVSIQHRSKPEVLVPIAETEQGLQGCYVLLEALKSGLALMESGDLKKCHTGICDLVFHEYDAIVIRARTKKNRMYPSYPEVVLPILIALLTNDKNSTGGSIYPVPAPKTKANPQGDSALTYSDACESKEPYKTLWVKGEYARNRRRMLRNITKTLKRALKRHAKSTGKEKSW